MGVGGIKKPTLSPEREQKDITGQIGQYPHSKVADVILVHSPKNDVFDSTSLGYRYTQQLEELAEGEDLERRAYESLRRYE